MQDHAAGMQDHAAEVPSAAVSRRQFLGTAGATGVGLGLGSGLLTSTVAVAGSGGSAVLPRPIPSGFVTPFGVFIHHHLPGRGIEASQITDFKGTIGLAQLTGTGTGTLNGTSSKLNFEIDNRFMQGTYVGVDGRRHRGTFGFI
ncbi:MAG: twin-arginine translocation signal domain-containing protein [Streptosporangiaceae bacterium]